MTRKSLLIVFIFVVVGVALVAFGILPKKLQAPTAPSQSATTTPATQHTVASIPDLISVTVPREDDTIVSPLKIEGSARGSWYFEATAPVSLVDASGTVLASGFITAQGDWTTSDFVPFEGLFTFTHPSTSTVGTLILQNDNPSGDPARDKILRIPVKF